MKVAGIKIVALDECPPNAVYVVSPITPTRIPKSKKHFAVRGRIDL